MLWMVPVMFSAPQKAFHSGNQVFISPGASVSGVFWKTILTPSMVISSKSLRISTLGGIRPVLPLATFLPIDWSTWPKGLRASRVPYWMRLRRVMALPAKTFSEMASCRKPSGAMIFTLPLVTSASSTTPRTPPKWSMWECE